MRKIPCLFVREFFGGLPPSLTEEVTPGCEWALAGKGIATRKWDGTACMVKNGNLYKRYDYKAQRRTKALPEGAIPCDPEPDEMTGHWPHWVPVTVAKEDRWHRLAWRHHQVLCYGTFELIGPMINGNREDVSGLEFRAHGADRIRIKIETAGHHGREIPWTFHTIKAILSMLPFEGIVFHHVDDDTRRCKIRRKDYGLPWPVHGDHYDTDVGGKVC